MAGLRLSSDLDASQRQLVLGVCVAGVCFMTLSASFTYVMDDMFIDLHATSQQSELMRQLPSLGALLVVFVASILGRRVGERRMLIACGLLSVIGAVCVLIAPAMSLATLGVLVIDMCHSGLIVVGLGLVSTLITSKDGRASAFSTYSAVIPATYVVMPLLTGAILASLSWRWVCVVWLIAFLLGTGALWRWLPARPAATEAGELVTPVLAGVLLAAVVAFLTNLHDSGWTARVAAGLIVAVVAGALLLLAMKRMSQPSLSLGPLRHGGLLILLIVLMMTMFANLWFYMTMGLEHIWGLTALAVAAVLIPAQFGSIVGAKVAGRLIKVKGIGFTGGGLLALNAVALGVSALMQLDTPVWVLVSVMTFYAATGVGASVALTNAIMNTSQKGKDGNAAAFRSAASSIGGAISVALMTSIVFFAASTSLQQQATGAGLDPTQTSQIATSLRDGTTPTDTATMYAVPTSEVDEVNDMQTSAYLVGFRTQGVVGGIVTLVAAGIFYTVRRRQERAAHMVAAST